MLEIIFVCFTIKSFIFGLFCSRLSYFLWYDWEKTETVFIWLLTCEINNEMFTFIFLRLKILNTCQVKQCYNLPSDMWDSALLSNFAPCHLQPILCKSTRYQIVDICFLSVLHWRLVRNLNLPLWEHWFIFRRCKYLYFHAVNLKTLDVEPYFCQQFKWFKNACDFDFVIILTNIIYLDNFVGSLNFWPSLFFKYILYKYMYYVLL